MMTNRIWALLVLLVLAGVLVYAGSHLSDGADRSPFNEDRLRPLPEWYDVQLYEEVLNRVSAHFVGADPELIRWAFRTEVEAKLQHIHYTTEELQHKARERMIFENTWLELAANKYGVVYSIPLNSNTNRHNLLVHLYEEEVRELLR